MDGRHRATLARDLEPTFRATFSKQLARQNIRRQPAVDAMRTHAWVVAQLAICLAQESGVDQSPFLDDREAARPLAAGEDLLTLLSPAESCRLPEAESYLRINAGAIHK